MSCIKEDDETSYQFPTLKHSPSLEGFSHLGVDGVYRSFSSTGEVVDYKQISPDELSKMMEFFAKYMDGKDFEELEKKFHGVDGRDVTDSEQLLHPGPGIGPEEFNK